MPGSGLPRSVERFIEQRLDSVALLETLLLVRAAPGRAWTAADVAHALVTRPEHAGAMLGQLAEHDLLAVDGAAYRYAPGDLAADVEALAEAYATRRPTVIGLIFAPRDAGAEALADAFRIRRRRS
jgi:hypothetical protein